jgi:O-antigen/teichoic acid export membrane protein
MNTEIIQKSSVFQKSVSAARYTLIYKILTQVVSLAVMVLIVRGLSEHDYGLYNLLYSMTALLGIVASFGIANT